VKAASKILNSLSTGEKWGFQTYKTNKIMLSRETDKLLFGVFTQLFFWNTKLFFKQGVSKCKGLLNTQLK